VNPSRSHKEGSVQKIRSSHHLGHSASSSCECERLSGHPVVEEHIGSWALHSGSRHRPHLGIIKLAPRAIHSALAKCSVVACLLSSARTCEIEHDHDKSDTHFTPVAMQGCAHMHTQAQRRYITDVLQTSKIRVQSLAYEHVLTSPERAMVVSNCKQVIIRRVPLRRPHKSACNEEYHIGRS
jgi:hypothetical protein